VTEARALGVSRAQLRSAPVRAPFTGVRVPLGLPDDLVTRCRAVALVLPAGAVFTGRTAVELLGLPWLLGAGNVLSDPLQVAVPPGVEPPRIQGVSAVQCRWAGAVHPGPHGLPVLAPVQLWCQVQGLPLVDHVALADAVRRRWASGPQMAEAVTARAGDRDVVRLRQVLSLVRYPVDSAMETRTRLLLVGAGLPEPRCGRDVREDGEWLAVPDLSWPQVKVAIEYEGDHHRTDRRQWQRDVRSRERLREHGWRVLLLTADDVLRRPEEVVARVAAALRERGLTW
jgi:hypothetical protein